VVKNRFLLQRLVPRLRKNTEGNFFSLREKTAFSKFCLVPRNL
jgi:hypothetical protein